MNLRSAQNTLAKAVIAAFLCLLLAHGLAVGQQTTEAQAIPSLPQVSPSAIPVAEVPIQATWVSNFLRSINTDLFSNDSEIKKIHQQLGEIREQSNRYLAATTYVLEEAPSLEMLQTQQQIWLQVQKQTSRWLSWLAGRATHVREVLEYLANLQDSWAKTRDVAIAANAHGPILDTIQGTMTALGAARPTLQTQNSRILDLQSSIAHEAARCEAMLTLVAQAQQGAMVGLLVRDALPFWSADLWGVSPETLRARVSGAVVVLNGTLGYFFRHASAALFVKIAIFTVLALLFCAARRQIARWSARGESPPPYASVFEYPYSAALLVPLMLGGAVFSQTPTMVRQLFNVLGVLPVVRLTRQVADAKLIPGLYALGVFFAVDVTRQALGGVPLLEQALLLSEASTGMALLGWYLIHQRWRYAQTQAISEAARPRTLQMGGLLILLTLALGFMAGFLGYLRLARLLVSGLFVAGILAIALHSLVRVMSGLLAVAMRVWPLRRLYMAQHHGLSLTHRAHRVMSWAAVVAWVLRVLDYVGLLEPAISLAGAVLFTKLEYGALSISLGDVVAFVLVLWASYLFSGLIRFVLREDVYPRTRIGSGLSYAINSLLRYLILTVGFIMGLAALGMDLNRVTVLAGALGVGIGFGLQSVVNNFVSGLILLFERPIHVGDTVEVDNLLGEVHHIGIRASKVRTRQGADIIVPNAQLVTERLTNWTLSDRMRRIDLTVGVNYGAAPAKVIEVLEQVALAHPHVLRHPPPEALFTGYGDSSINFELRAWTEQFDNWARIRSDLAVALYDAVQQAGMQFPFPQREVRLLHDNQDSGSQNPSPAKGPAAMAEEGTQGSIDDRGDIGTTNHQEDQQDVEEQTAKRPSAGLNIN